MKTEISRAAIFDLDDTLVDTSHIYWLSRSAFLDCMAQAGFDRDVSLAAFEDIDAKNILEYGYVPERYGHSMLTAYSELCAQLGAEVLPRMVEQIQRAGEMVRDNVPALIPGAIELVEGARALGYFVVLLTRGVYQVQQKKLELRDLARHFERVEIVAKKNADSFKEIIKSIGIRAADCWVIGDSVRSDINPAIQAGANGILYLYTHHSYYWRQEYGVEPLGEFHLARDLREVLRILESPSEVPRITVLPGRDPALPS
jgi:putative hydrolase of the HAD superfamily